MIFLHPILSCASLFRACLFILLSHLPCGFLQGLTCDGILWFSQYVPNPTPLSFLYIPFCWRLPYSSLSSWLGHLMLRTHQEAAVGKASSGGLLVFSVSQKHRGVWFLCSSWIGIFWSWVCYYVLSNRPHHALALPFLPFQPLPNLTGKWRGCVPLVVTG